MMIGWLYLLFGTIGEVLWVLSLKLTEGFTRLWPSIINLLLSLFNVWVLTKAFNILPTAYAYSIWVGVSAIAIAYFSPMLQGEEITLTKALSMGLILLGVMGLKIFGSS